MSIPVIVTSALVIDHLNITDKGRVDTILYLQYVIVILFIVGIGITTISNCAKERYLQIWSTSDEGVWPPYQPKMFSQYILVQHTKTGCQYEPVKENMVTKGIGAIIGILEKHENHTRILIEGAPGIGKTVLLKEIAYRWSKNYALQKFKLVILTHLRDPAVQKMTEMSHFLLPFVQKDTKFAKTASAYMHNLSSKEIIFIFDGFDELPENLQKDSLIVDIIKQKILPHCAVVVSSRPCASAILCHHVTTKIKILGFTMDDAICYIETALKGQPHKINALTQYLNNQPVINNFLRPSDLAILTDLCKHEESLPKTYTEMYNNFIFLTIRRHLNKYGEHNITKLTALPEPYNRIIQLLSKFAYDALTSSKCIFTLDEVKATCPGIEGVDDVCGLLQAHYFNDCTTYKFLYLTIQEFLAAHYLSTLSSSEFELTVLKEKFWHDDYFNMFSFYVGLTKGQRPSFKKFLSDKEIVHVSFKSLDQLKCLRLHQCFYEAGCTEICNSLEQSQAFMSQAIDLACTALSLIDVTCTTFFLLSSNIKWLELNLRDCCIQDHGVYVLYHALCSSKNVQITTLQLSYNGLTEASSSMIGDIVINCNVKKLWINGNHFIGESQKLCSMLADDLSTLESLYMVDIKLSSRAATSIFLSLTHNNTIKELVITENNITDDACGAITRALMNNNSLVKLWMWNNPIRTESLLSILQVLHANNTLALLGLPNCPEKTKVVFTSLQQKINKKRESRGCQVKLVIDFM